MYLTFSEYQEMGGTLSETTFNDYEFEARAQVDWYTFNRLQNEETQCENVKRCMYHLIHLIELQAQAMTLSGDGSSSKTVAGVASQSNDGVSISYNTLSAKDMVDMIGPDIKKTVTRYLQGVMNSLGQKVLYRGLYQNE